MDENFEWWWSVTKLQAQVLNEGLSVIGVKDHSNLLFHYGGVSGNDFRNSKGMDLDGKEVIKWFKKKKINIIEKIEDDNIIYNPKSKTNKLFKKTKKI